MLILNNLLSKNIAYSSLDSAETGLVADTHRVLGTSNVGAASTRTIVETLDNTNYRMVFIQTEY